MHFLGIAILCLAISLESFSLALMTGANQRPIPTYLYLIISLVYGSIQAITLMIGMSLSLVLMHNQLILMKAHLIALLILSYLGIHRLRQLVRHKTIIEKRDEFLNYKRAIQLALSTSFDVLLAGLIFGLVQTEMSITLIIIFITTCFFVASGLRIGERFGSRYGSLMIGCSGGIIVAMTMKMILSSFGGI